MCATCTLCTCGNRKALESKYWGSESGLTFRVGKYLAQQSMS